VTPKYNTFSGRQLKMLQMFADNREGEYLSYSEAHNFDQRPFRSMLIRQWISYRPGRGFHITREGRAALHRLNETDIARNQGSISQPLTRYFDAVAYGLDHPNKRKLRIVRQGAA
jgi:hypothetical protein